MYFNLFISFAKMGLFTFGGGYAMLPLLKREVVEVRSWATEEEILDYYAVGQCTPGLIAVNTATFVGYKVGGFFGSLVATVGLVLPPFIIIAVIARIINEYSHLTFVTRAFSGVRLAVCALVAKAVYDMAKKSVIDKFTCCIAIGAFIASAIFGLSPIIPVICAIILGIVFGGGAKK